MNNKELEEYKAKQEATKAAELKAKLDMVETRPKLSHGRAPRKIGTMVCDSGIKTGYRNAEVSFVLRLDGDGTFIAEHGDVWYCSKSRDALKAKMDQVAKVTLDLRWTRYLLVEYKATVPYDGSWRSDTIIDIDATRKKDTVVFGIELRWEVVEYSDAIELPGQGARYMKRDVGEDGEPEDAQETVAELPDGLVPYTKEREEMLLRLRAALTQVDARMVELFRGSPKQVATQLDQAGGAPLLLEASVSSELKPRPKKSSR